MHLIAHQGGWDEALFVLGPLLLIVALLRLAKRRADRASMSSAEPASPPAIVRDDVERRGD